MTPLFINTRPTAKSLDLQGLQGLDVVHLPLLAIHHFQELQAHENQAMADFLAGKFNVVVAVSVEAVRCVMDFLGKMGIFCADNLPFNPQKTHFVAVGEPTRKALQDFGLAVITPADYGQTMNNEGMLALPVMTDLSEQSSVLIWRGVSGRRLLHDTLVARGVIVQAVAWYERTKPLDLQENFNKLSLANHHPIFVPITSEMSLHHWQSLPLPDAFFVYLPLGERLFELTRRAYPTAPVLPVADLTDETLRHTLRDFLQEFSHE